MAIRIHPLPCLAMAYQGTVRSFIEETGYGFITPDDDDKDVFLHWSDVRLGGNPDAGDRVRFDIRTVAEQRQAYGVVVIRGRPDGGTAPAEAYTLPPQLEGGAGGPRQQPAVADDEGSSTIGIPSFDSPTGRRAFDQFWIQVQQAALVSTPNIEVSTQFINNATWCGCVAWGMIRWNVLEPHPHMLRPQLWHTTVVRWSWQQPPTVRSYEEERWREAECNSIEAEMESILDTLLGYRVRDMPLELVRPTFWPQSYNFGLAGKAERISNALVWAGETIVSNLMPDAVIAERRPVHVSWH